MKSKSRLLFFSLSLFIILILLCNSINVHGADTGATNPTDSSNVSRSKTIWSNPTNVYSGLDDTYATNDIGSKTYSDWIYVHDFGFDLPEGSTIDGILCEIEDYGEGDLIQEYELYLYFDGSIQGDDKMGTAYLGDMIDTDTYASYGSDSDTWNSGITETDLETTAFGVYISYYNTHNTQPRMAYIDHVRITVYYSIPTEENAPHWDNLIESHDPLELGCFETIQIDVTDESVITDVDIELNSVNYSMSNIGGDTYQYKWKPASTGLIEYIIWMTDEFNNINSTNGDITVVDTTNPIISNLGESHDPLELGCYESIEVDVTDNNTLHYVYIELNSVNYSMSNIGGDTYRYSWQPSATGLIEYIIWTEDYAGLYASDDGNDITVIDTTDPVISNVIESSDPLYLGLNETIECDITDNNTIYFVYLEFDNINHTMTIKSGVTYEYFNWLPETIGVKNYIIWVNDSAGNIAYHEGSIEVIESGDLIAPSYRNLIIEFNPCELGNYVKFTIEINDTAGVSYVYLQFNGVNYSMNDLGDDIYYFAILPNYTGSYQYVIWFSDTLSNIGSISGTLIVQDSVFVIFSIIIMVNLMGLILLMFIKLKIYIVILVIYLFSLMIGINSLQYSEIPFFPNFSTLFLVFQSIIFLFASIQKFEQKLH